MQNVGVQKVIFWSFGGILEYGKILQLFLQNLGEMLQKFKNQKNLSSEKLAWMSECKRKILITKVESVRCLAGPYGDARMPNWPQWHRTPLPGIATKGLRRDKVESVGYNLIMW